MAPYVFPAFYVDMKNGKKLIVLFGFVVLGIFKPKQ